VIIEQRFIVFTYKLVKIREDIKIKESTPRITFHVSNNISRASEPQVSSSLWLSRTDLTASDVKAESKLIVPYCLRACPYYNKKQKRPNLTDIRRNNGAKC
jgi:hypothetical protein